MQSEVIISIYLFIEKIQAILYLIMIIHKKKKKSLLNDFRLFSVCYMFLRKGMIWDCDHEFIYLLNNYKPFYIEYVSKKGENLRS